MNTLKLSSGMKWLCLAALLGAAALHFGTDYSLGGASPLALLLTASAGWLLRTRFSLAGNLLLLLAGGALLLFPFMNIAHFAYTLLALPVAALGLIGTLAWWHEQ